MKTAIGVTMSKSGFLFARIISFSIISSSAIYLFFPKIFLSFFSRAWDGSGHQAIAQIYSNSIFPDTFGWSSAYFGGMPFPNFYPPFFYWCIGLLSRFIPFEAAFKLMIFLPTLALSAVLWHFIYSLTDKNRFAAWAGATGSLFLLLDARFIFALPAGLDFFSTFQIGLYTQPLGFVCLLLWYIGFQKTANFGWRFSLSAILLALTVLSNFFAGIAAALMAIVVIFEDAARWRQSVNKFGKVEESKNSSTVLIEPERPQLYRKKFFAHILSCFAALCLTLFWLAPMISQYEYFVTRPFVVDIHQLLSPAWWFWFALAIAGFYIWYRNQTKAFWSFTISCLILAVIVGFATIIAPDWFPLQSPRFLAMLNFLLVVPVGLAVSKGFRRLAKLLGEIKSENETLSLRRVKYTFGVLAFLFVVLMVSSPGTRTGAGYAFIAKGEKPEIEQILDFAKKHRDGRYLVEVIHPQKTPAYTDAAFDARAINAYLGSNGNETLSAVFHEASPQSLFTLPVINSLSDYPDSFGISSVLSDDLDFQSQPIEKHIERAKFLGVKYLVIRTPPMKERLSKVKEIQQKYDFGWWTVYELKTEEQTNPTARVLPNRPALVISNFTLKARYRSDLSYIRFVEEQFADGWFDILLAKSPETKIDRLQDWENFGAVIVNDYKYDDQAQAFEKIKEIAQKRLVVLISGDDALFQKVRQSRTEFPKLEIIERPKYENSGEMLKSDHPTFHYNESPIRQMWQRIRQILEANKIPTQINEAQITGQKFNNQIKINLISSEELPVLIPSTFHPNWTRTDNAAIYPATPFYQLTFANQPIELKYGRNTFDKMGLYVSGIFLIGLFSFIIVSVLNTEKKKWF